jgi:hypothetical protein
MDDSGLDSALVNITEFRGISGASLKGDDGTLIEIVDARLSGCGVAGSGPKLMLPARWPRRNAAPRYCFSRRQIVAPIGSLGS